jgi:hypothetical protein
MFVIVIRHELRRDPVGRTRVCGKSKANDREYHCCDAKYIPQVLHPVAPPE